METLTEAGIIQAALQNQPEAWKHLLTEHGGRMYGIALRLMRKEREAEDAVQEAWLVVSQKLRDFRGDCKLSTWLYRIVANKCLEKIRLSKREKNSTGSFEDLLPQFQEDGHYQKEFADWSRCPDKETDQKALRTALQKAVDELPAEYREVLIMRDIQGLSGQEVSEILQMSEANMKTRLHRGRMALREKLERRYGKKPWTQFLGLLLF